MPPNAPTAQQFDLYKYMRMIWRRKWLLILPLALCVPIAVAAAYYIPTEYESTAILELQMDKPMVEGGGPVGLNAGVEIPTMRTRMLSWSSIREMVLSRHVDLGKDIDPDDRRQLERVHFEINHRTFISALGPRHIRVAHRSTSPQKNASLVNELVKNFVGDDRRVGQELAKQDLKYYREKYAAAQARLSEVDAQIREFMQANPWLRDAVSDIHTEYKEAEEKEREITAEIGEFEQELNKRRNDLKKEKPEVEKIVKTPPAPELADAQRNYDQMKGYFDQVKSAYNPPSAKYQDAKRRVNEAAAYLKKMVAEKGGGESEVKQVEPNTVYAQIDGEVKKYEKTIEKLNQRKLAVNKRVNELYVLVRRAPELMAQSRKLNEDRAVFAATSEEYSRYVRASEKELQRLMTDAYSSRFKVLEYAREEFRPVRSTQMKIIMLGILLGLLTGAGLVALLEYLDQTFKTIDDAREYLNIPALGVIPAIFTPRDHRRRLWFRLLAVSSAVFVLGVAVAIYIEVPPVKEFLSQTAWAQFREWMEYW